MSGLVPYLTRAHPYQTYGHPIHLDNIPPSPFFKHSGHTFGGDDDDDDDEEYEKFTREVKKDVKNNAVVDYVKCWINHLLQIRLSYCCQTPRKTCRQN